MKLLKTSLFALFLLLSTSFAGDRKVKHSGFIAPGTKFTFLNEQFGWMGGGKVAYLYNSFLAVGVGGYSLLNETASSNPSGYDVEFYYGGLTLDYIIRPFELVHGGFSLLAGMGSFDLSKGTKDKDDVYIVEPEWFFEGNITKFLQVDMGIGYRMVFGSSRYIGGRIFDASNIMASIQFKFGHFRIDY